MANRDAMLSGPFIMLLSAAIFGYFGYFIGLTPTATTGEYVFFFALLLWTLRIGAVAFAVAGVLTLIARVIGNAIYAVAGLLSAIALVVVGVMDLMNDQYAAAISPILAFLFAAWNGYGAWQGLRDVLAASGSRRDERAFGGAGE